MCTFYTYHQGALTRSFTCLPLVNKTRSGLLIDIGSGQACCTGLPCLRVHVTFVAVIGTWSQSL